MIYVERTIAPEIFTKANSPAKRERLKAEKVFSVDPPTERFEAKFYSAYKDNYKEQLLAMFNSRCAYCECFVTIGNRGDIEHFRPKSEYLSEDLQKHSPGYYWLAADWLNLYLSCTHCNQVTTFNILDANNPSVVIRESAGKSTQFGLADENFRRNHHSLRWEEEEPHRLLIDPCKDHPASLLEFTEDGIVLAKARSGMDKRKVDYSIKVYVLQREVLVKARKQHWVKVMEKVSYLSQAIEFVFENLKSQLNNSQAKFNKTQLEETFNQLMTFLDCSLIPNQFIGLSRQFLHPFLTEYSNKIIAFLSPVDTNEAWCQPAVDYFKPQVTGLKNYMDKL